jgi:hypothetical protein
VWRIHALLSFHTGMMNSDDTFAETSGYVPSDSICRERLTAGDECKVPWPDEVEFCATWVDVDLDKRHIHLQFDDSTLTVPIRGNSTRVNCLTIVYYYYTHFLNSSLVPHSHCSPSSASRWPVMASHRRQRRSGDQAQTNVRSLHLCGCVFVCVCVGGGGGGF